jgi:hypothetical protein
MSYASALDFPAGLRSFGRPAFPTFEKWLQSAHDHFIPHERNNYHPHILGHRFLGLVSLLLVAVKVSLVASLALSPAVSLSSAITTGNIVSLTNQSRVQYGLPELTLNTKLSQAAQNKANDMLAKGYFAHNTPDGKTPWSFIKATGYSYLSAGENLAVDFTQAESVSAAWMNSPGHRANILNKSFQEIGIGIAFGMWQGHQTTFVVQMFGTPVAQKVTLQEQPTPVAASAPAPVTASTPQVFRRPTPVTAYKAAPSAPAAAPSAPAMQNQTVASAQESPLAALPPVKIIDASAMLDGSNLKLIITTAESATKVMASFKGGAIMLDPKSSTIWQGNIPLSVLGGDGALAIQALDMQGRSDSHPLASFSSNLEDNYNLFGKVKGATANFFGNVVDVKSFEDKFFMLAIATLLTCLILAIAIKRHVQHVSLVANSSFVIALAALLWIGG